MFQIEILEYTPKISDIYNHFHNNISGRSNQNLKKDSINYDLSLNNTTHHIEDSIENKFLKIKTVNHPLISRYFNYMRDDNNYIFISDYAGDGLDELMDVKLSEKTYFKQDDVIKILFQIILAIYQLEKKGINLRYLEPKRILINDEGSVKIRNYIVDILFNPEEVKLIKLE
jgi:serine/threonine protein kinase